MELPLSRCEKMARKWDDRILDLQQRIGRAEVNGRGTKGLMKQLETADRNYDKYVDDCGNFKF